VRNEERYVAHLKAEHEKMKSLICGREAERAASMR